ncbi:MAG: FAD-dependent monooxygenase [Burkholderiales bacterium]|nr:FAD-dependent monooxygenase [Burkholderiales bacterium]
MKIVIVGAGVAGCIVARALAARPGVEVTCLERVAASDHSESGTGLNVGPNAVKALAAHDRRLGEAVLARSFPWKSWRVSLTDGTVLFDLPLARVADNDGIRIRWSELYAALRGEAAGLIRYGAQVVRIAYAEAGRLCIEYDEHGARRRLDGVDLLVAADGRYSVTREQLAGAPQMRQHGVAIYRLLVPDTAGGLIDDYEQWFNGPNRLLAFRVPGDAIYVAGTFPIAPGAEIAEDARRAPFLRALYTPAHGAPSPQCRWLIDTICANVGSIHWARLQESPPLYRDARGRVLFLGDASHGMVPTLGQGATQAVEDACVAADLLVKHHRAGALDSDAVPALLEEFERLRAARVRFVMDFSREASDTLMAGADPVAGTRRKLEAPFQAQLARLYRDITTV